MRKKWFCQDCRLEMKYDQKNDRYICPNCNVEVWYPIDDDYYLKRNNAPYIQEISTFMSGMSKTHAPKECIPAGEAIIKGSSKSSKGRKKSMKKDSLATLNKKLFVQV